MDAIYRKHHLDGIEANNRIVNRVPNQIESITEAQTQTIEGVFELTTQTQSLGERIDVLARSLGQVTILRGNNKSTIPTLEASSSTLRP